MEIESNATLKNIINQQNKQIEFLYKEQDLIVEKINRLIEENERLKEQLKIREIESNY